MTSKLSITYSTYDFLLLLLLVLVPLLEALLPPLLLAAEVRLFAPLPLVAAAPAFADAAPVSEANVPSQSISVFGSVSFGVCGGFGLANLLGGKMPTCSLNLSRQTN